jgi:hypothetical protein
MLLNQSIKRLNKNQMIYPRMKMKLLGRKKMERVKQRITKMKRIMQRTMKMIIVRLKKEIS